jgi:hypothetical protein
MSKHHHRARPARKRRGPASRTVHDRIRALAKTVKECPTSPIVHHHARAWSRTLKEISGAGIAVSAAVTCVAAVIHGKSPGTDLIKAVGDTFGDTGVR